MSWTKRDYIEQAFVAIGMADYTFDLESDEYRSALIILDTMMAEWDSKGIRLGWPLSSRPKDSILDQDCNVSDHANSAISLNLAVRIAPTYGKVPMDITLAQSKQALNFLLISTTEIPQRTPNPNLPAGAGNRNNSYFGNPYLRGEDSGKLEDPEKKIDFW